MVVTPEAADERFTPVRAPAEEARVRCRYGLPRRFVLYAGSAEKRKNPMRRVAARSEFTTENPPIQ